MEPLPITVMQECPQYWRGTEAGRLGVYDTQDVVIATDGSAADGTMGAGWILIHQQCCFSDNAMVDGSEE